MRISSKETEKLTFEKLDHWPFNSAASRTERAMPNVVEMNAMAYTYKETICMEFEIFAL